MNKVKKIKLLPIYIALASSLTGCGGQSYYGVPSSNSNNQIPIAAPSPNPSVPVTPTPTISPDPTPTSTLPPITASFQLTGTRGGTPSTPSSVKFSGINTDSILRVAFTGQQIGSVANTGYSIYSSCLQFNVTLDGGYTQTVSVNTLSSDGTGKCGSGTANPVADFSAQMTPGHGPASITISNAVSNAVDPNTVYQCINYWYGQPCYSTTLQTLYYTWTVSGGIKISTNGTQ